MKTTVLKDDMELIKKHLSNICAATLPTSFHMDKHRVDGIPESFRPLVTVDDKGETLDKIFEGTDPQTGLSIKTIITEYKSFPVFDIVTYYTNTSQSNTPVISDIIAFSGKFRAESQPYLYSNTGDYLSDNGYETKKEYFWDQMSARFSPTTGRPCNGAFPFFKVQFEDCGYNIAVGWPGQWFAQADAVDKGLSFQAGQELISTYLKPGESLLSPKITIMAYAGDYERGVNLWRRWYYAHVLPKQDGQPLKPRISAIYDESTIAMEQTSEENQLATIRKISSTGVPYTTLWLDAGWYDCYNEKSGKDDWLKTGTWVADPKRFPNGFKPVSDALKAQNMEFLLWFEPERVRPDTEIYREHPEWLLSVKPEYSDDPDAVPNYLLNLGDKDCCDWLIQRIDKAIKEYGVDIYRQDFNFGPLRYWRENEEYDRRGSLENFYIQGYLRYWDTLLELNPGLIIDSCASGGRRNDLETLRRSVPLHPTDYAYGIHPIGQAFSRTLHSWIPYFRSVITDWDLPDGTYQDWRNAKNRPLTYFAHMSAIAAFFSPGFRHDTEEENELDRLTYRIWKRAADLLLISDYYPLSATSKSSDSYFVNQFYCPEKKCGFVQAARNVLCSEETFVAGLYEIEADKAYKFEEMRFGVTLTISGKELLENGFPIRLNKRDAAVWFYSIEE